MPDKNKAKTVRMKRRKFGIRKRLTGTPERPRLSVFRSSKHIYAQVIDDYAGKTVATASTLHEDVKGGLKHGANIAAAKAVGKSIAEKAKAVGVSKVSFDRAGNRYHGRIKALADAAREGGLQF
jgi:large subunit ribosomal protein L18